MKHSRYKRIATTALISFLMAMNTLPVQVRADEELPQEEITEQTYDESEILTEEEPSEEYTPEPVDEQTVEVEAEPTEAAPEVVEEPAAEPVEEPVAEPVEESAEEYEEPVENALGKADFPGEIIVESEDNQHYYVDLDGFTVTVTTQPGAFEEKAVLSTSVLENDSEEYQTAEEALKESEQAYDGMLAFDIHFENAEGVEIEPNGKVTVKFTAKAEVLSDIAPDTVDASSIQILHIVETPEEESAAIAEVVADNSADTPDVNVVISDNAVEKVSADFDVESFSTFALTWKVGDEDQGATIHFVELNNDGTFTELGPEVSLDTNAASVSLSTDFPDVVEGENTKEYRYVAGYYSTTEATVLDSAGIVPINAVLTKTEDGKWECDPTLLGADNIPVANGSHIYATYKQFVPAGNTPSGGDASKIKPDAFKNVSNNNDGTYTIRLDINGHQLEEKQGANILLIFDRTSSMEENNMGSVTRMVAAQRAVHTLIDALQPGTNPIKVAVLSFHRSADDDYVSWTSDGSAITNFTDGLEPELNGSYSGHGGTNWEAAFDKAKNIITTLPEADASNPTYLVFLTDGNPTFYNGATSIHSEATNADPDYTRARTSASGVNSAIPIYGIYCANEGAWRLLEYLMNDLATADYGSHTTSYIPANSQDALNQAFSAIANTILDTLGASQSTTNDGITSLTTTSATAGAAGSFKYYKTTRPSGLADDAIIPENQLVPWDNAPAASYSPETGVTWDLESEGILADNTSYTLEFTVWPSQAAYDLLADLNNGIKVYEAGHENSITDEERAQVYQSESDGKFYLRTNTNFDTTYTFNQNTYTDNGTTQSQSDMVLTTDEISAKKEWLNLLDSRDMSQDYPTVDLAVSKDGKHYLDVTLSEATGWQVDGIDISCGILLDDAYARTHGLAVSNYPTVPGPDGTTYYLLETGHDYSMVESGAGAHYYDLVADVYRPMVINGTRKMLVKVDAADNTTYTIDGKFYKEHTSVNLIDAINHRRSWLNLTKVLSDDSATPPEGTLFEYTIQITVPADVIEAESDEKYILFQVRDKDGGVVDTADITTTAQIYNSNYLYVESGTTFTLSIEEGWNVRFLNLISRTEFEITETEENTFEFVSVVGTARQNTGNNASGTWHDVDWDTTVAGTKISGSITQGNTDFTAKYTNKYLEIEIPVEKKWLNADGSTTWPTSVASVTVKLLADDADTGKTVTLTSAKQSDKFTNGDRIHTRRSRSGWI